MGQRAGTHGGTGNSMQILPRVLPLTWLGVPRTGLNRKISRSIELLLAKYTDVTDRHHAPWRTQIFTSRKPKKRRGGHVRPTP